MNQENKQLRYGWTTGACATAAAKAAYHAIHNGFFLDCVEITLPQGKKVTFFLLKKEIISANCAIASVIKDAGDDPDVTHGAEIIVQIKKIAKGEGIVFKAGEGVGTITKPGLPLAVGEPAINPVPRQMICNALAEITADPDAEVTIGVTNGKEIALKTMNPRLGILGGLSILGTTGIVVPFSCAAWIASIHRGIDVARAEGIDHLIASTGNVSERAAQKLYDAPESALIEMGDFAGGVLKYIKTHPVKKLTLAGGVAKMTKLAQGHLDLHSKRSSVDLNLLVEWVVQLGADEDLVSQIRKANTTAEVFFLCQGKIPLGDFVAGKAFKIAQQVLVPVSIKLEILLFDRQGQCHGIVANGIHLS
ncbi:cobalt-precorrin-5B (C(1))-methyltransferase [Commensalibacter papalotli (ex Botero et al. 2024)]|uniref:Cobalt-precorrin-5B C(1)-methyltransferase n=1 Tax=Commensalibacter papalotli (ex Botero et al. 2024) TaxID=2972766 RepID=A0ABM9HT78_9PROT|nr:cobalt-precorrin-5B (C(1))-methyltransferase [Commensalibacter papalotli (ex Botero et al. 2024)]CAI3953811.1 Cobalamin biosynthesis protein CbiD (cobalt-precorrin-5B C-methyltransferase) (CbiD) (PDB:1SR8) [Commensalibacter papalotli (ex Botero et al. 2024)]CAI3954321.1 Cobalamin biosynthesis protein CbiD (cobalt-precorrin-5B C-methyltransferase) (CbiD) (PDB:1SR8) [Commensalibacter papalotli (ex Botero et al. 2024)]